MMCLLGGGQVIDNDFGRSKVFRSPQVTALKHFHDRMVGMGRIVTLRNRIVQVRVKPLADACLRLDAVPTEQLTKLVQSHFHTLTEFLEAGRPVRGQGAFEIVNHRQQFLDKRFLLRGCAGLGFLTAASFEILKVGGQVQEQILLLGEILAEWVQLAWGLNCRGLGYWSIRRLALGLGVHKSMPVLKGSWAIVDFSHEHTRIELESLAHAHCLV